MAQERETEQIQTASLRWSFPRNGKAGPDSRGEWVVDVTLAEVAGKYEVVGVGLRSCDSDGKPVKGRSLRAVGASELRLLSVPDLRREAIIAVGSGSGDRSVSDLAYRSLQGRTRSDELHHLEVAEVYAAAWRRGDKPRVAVREHFAGRGVVVSDRTIARWVERCRDEYQFLHKTTERQADGRLTTRAKRLRHERNPEAEGISR